MPYTHSFDTIATGLTVGMVVHPSLDEDGGGPARGRALAPPTLETLIARNGIFRLSLDNSNGRRLRWTVATAEGPVATAVGTTRFPRAGGPHHVVKATFNATSAVAKVFVDGVLEGASAVPAAAAETAAAPRAQRRFSVRAAAGQGIVVGDGFEGALEEIFIKNVSTELRTAYLYADPARLQGSYLIDLTSPDGSALFAKRVDAVLNQVSPGAAWRGGPHRLDPWAGDARAASPDGKRWGHSVSQPPRIGALPALTWAQTYAAMCRLRARCFGLCHIAGQFLGDRVRWDGETSSDEPV